ncbi:kinase-like domain-containing protein [Gigaspora rosea]|uniref:non-specific serine/threonine protein kinase n=1 Tax=Gigaspora rosea TaxID=44941 RepID=A0A397UGS3_9GLOM|nr:kinase-like domain-containing protein [Gigaspora rosea]
MTTFNQNVDNSSVFKSHPYDPLYPDATFTQKIHNQIARSNSLYQTKKNSVMNYHSTLKKNDPRLDSAISMPSAKQSTTCYETSKSASMYIKNNESLERWVDNLLNEFDQVMSVNLNTNIYQDNSRRVKELIKQFDDRLSKNIPDDIEGLREYVRGKKFDYELKFKNESSNHPDTIDETYNENDNADETISVNRSTDTTKVQQSALNLLSNLSKKQPARFRVAKFIKKVIAKKSLIAEKDIPSTDSCNYCPTPQETRISNHDQIDPVKSRIETARKQNLHIIGTIVKRNKYERLLNGRYLIDKKDTVGEGHHGKVFKGVDLQNNTCVAVKCLKKQFTCSIGRFQIADKKQKKRNAEIIHEGKIMLRTDGLPNLVPLLDLVETPRKVYYIMPLANKDLSDVIYRRRMSEHCVRELLKPIFEAVKGLHDSGFVHRDIKPENIMLYQDGFAKLGDFGLSTEFGYHSGLQVVGTPAFAAPEVLGQFHRTDKLAWLNYKRADLWSLGATLYVCLAGRYPFDENQPISEQSVSNISFPERRFKHYSSNAVDLIQKLMVFDPLRRISIDEALQHPFFTSE